jgi:lipoprotein-anchoring transpeptidase ErfK/SrfK
MEWTKWNQKAAKLAGVILLTLLLTAAVQAQTVPVVDGPHARRVVLVSIPDRQVAVLEDGVVIGAFPVSVGARISPSPVGEFRIVNRVSNPTYYHAGAVISPGADNPVGPRWIGLSDKGYGIHGTNEPWSVGRAASHGCIRLRNRDIKRLFAMVRVGDTVEIRSARDEQTAAIFGGVVETGKRTLAQAGAPSADGQ